MRKSYIYGTLIIVGVIALITIFVVIFVARSKSEVNPVIVAPIGKIKGVKIKSEISDFNVFYSIPYAEPPIGALRFKAPQPKQPWHTTYDATVPGPACAQTGAAADTSEACLTLSVAAPAERARPVLVYLLGGALERGNARYYGPHYFMQYDMVVVIVQFRLDILGFLNLGSKDAPGNMALADVIAALQWVQGNIESFGGDRDRVTVGGLSSGGIMAHALQLSPRAPGLFHQVFMQSGTALSYRFYSNDTTLSITKTKEVLNMTDSSDEELLEHLQAMSTVDLLRINQDVKEHFPRGYNEFYTFPMTKDHAGILPEDPIELLRNNAYPHIPMLLGYTSEEGLRMEVFADRLDYVNDHFEMVVPTDLHPIHEHSAGKAETANRIKEFYFGEEDLSLDTFDQYANLCTDSWYAHITDYPIRLQGTLNYTAPVYYYIFAVDGKYNYEKFRSGITRPGAVHSDDLGYNWKLDLFANVISTDDFSDTSRERYVNMLYNFVNSGNPTPHINSLIPIKWEPVAYPNVKYLLFNRTLSMEEDLFRDRLLFWQRLYGFEEI